MPGSGIASVPRPPPVSMPTRDWVEITICYVQSVTNVPSDIDLALHPKLPAPLFSTINDLSRCLGGMRSIGREGW
jgi:hypothetical protein